MLTTTPHGALECHSHEPGNSEGSTYLVKQTFHCLFM